MSQSFARMFAPSALSSTLEALRARGRDGLLAVLGGPEREESPALPKLDGEALAKHHLSLAIDACRAPGTSKPQAFAKLRLLVNQLEQGRAVPPTRVTVPRIPEVSPVPTMGRRQKLLSRAVQGAHQFAEWRKAALESQSELR